MVFAPSTGDSKKRRRHALLEKRPDEKSGGAQDFGLILH
jgi:hypothetical protein